MNKKYNFARNQMTAIAGLVLGMLISLVPGSAFGQAYEGAEYCKTCHEANYNDWKASGHPYKLMKGQEAKYRAIPLPGGFDWPEGDVLEENDVSYVIGGYKWKSRYIDHEGYIITVTCEEDMFFDGPCNERDGVNQYNYLTGEWVDYHPGEEKKPYDCGVCHTTNWVADEDAETDGDLSDNQDGLPGMWGTFDDGGIHCEQCHGNGIASMDIDRSAEACGECHYRTSPPGSEVNTIPASGGFIKHHEQYNEFLASPHSEQECVTCHDPHKRGEFSIKEDATCTSSNCHDTEPYTTTYMQSPMAGYGVECKDCHMPYASKSANQLGPFEGDLQTHLFYINTDDTANMFTEDGSNVALDFAVPGKPEKMNKGAVTLDFACKRCHETAEMTELGKFAKNFHGTDDSVSELEYIGLNAGLTGHWWGGIERNGEGFLLEVANAGGQLTLIVSFYTYDPDGNQIWLIAFGPANTGMTSDVAVFISEGRKWGEDSNQSDFTEEFGTATFNFPACDVGNFTMTPNAKYMGLGYTSIDYDLNREVTDYQIACPTFDNGEG